MYTPPAFEKPDRIFTALVVASSPGTYTVSVVREVYGGVFEGDAGMRIQGTLVSPMLASFLGFKDSHVPQPGSRVLCVSESTRNCYILGVLPKNTKELTSLPGRTTLGAGEALDDISHGMGHKNHTTMLFDVRRPADVVDGEHVISNEFGVLLGLYQQMAHLKASELAQVQCYLLDDLVRIISHNFQHYTALGEYNVWHDGKKLMAEFGATHRPTESYGKPAVYSEFSGPAFTKTDKHTTDDADDFFKINEDERIKAIERFKLFLGSVGDFVHLFVVRPHPVATRILDGGKDIDRFDTGLADVHLGTDGGVHVRSVKEVFIEKTNWIRVPHRKAAPEDPKGDDGETLNYEKKQKFSFKDQYKYKNNPFAYGLQIRDYVAYVNEKLGYQNFKSHKKDFKVNDDVSKEFNLRQATPIDSDTPFQADNYELRTAGVYIMPNGGITIRDAWNSAIVMEGGNIYIQPAKDLISQPLRNNVVKAGGNISMACKKHIDLSSTEKGLRLKAEENVYVYSKSGGIVLESESTTDTPGTPEFPAPKALEKVGGIVLKSKLSIYNYAEKNVVDYAKQNLLFQAKKHIDIVADENITSYAKKDMFNMADGNINVDASLSAIFVADGGVIVGGAGSTVLGQKDQDLGVMYDSKSKFVDVIKGVLDVPQITQSYSALKTNKKELLKQTVFQEEQKLEKLKFRFPATQQYGKLTPNEDAIPATLSQQEDKTTGFYGLSAWTEQEVNGTLPFPGKDVFNNFYIDSDALKNLEKTGEYTDCTNKADPQQQPSNLQLKSLQQYKVQNA